MTGIRVTNTAASDRRHAVAEATTISHVTAILATILVLGGGVLAFFGALQSSGLALFGALAMSIASVAGRPSRGYRWVGPVIVGAAMVAVIIASFSDAR